MNTVISVKLDKTVNESVQEVAKSAGVTLSTLVNAYLRQVVAPRRTPFSIRHRCYNMPSNQLVPIVSTENQSVSFLAYLTLRIVFLITV